VILGYDYVGKIEDDDQGSSEYDGDHRIEGKFFWSLPLIRYWDLSRFSPINQKLSVDLILELAAIYDLENSSVAPEAKVSLDLQLSKVKKPDDQPKVTFSFVNGKTAPKFENFDAFFAGISFPF
jgi:hypothetical protein